MSRLEQSEFERLLQRSLINHHKRRRSIAVAWVGIVLTCASLVALFAVLIARVLWD